MMEHTTEQAKAILEQHDEIRIALVFGSLAEGRARPDSDLDIGVAGPTPLSAMEKLELMDELAAQFGRPIDLIDLSTASAPILRQVLTKEPQVNQRPAQRLRHAPRGAVSVQALTPQPPLPILGEGEPNREPGRFPSPSIGGGARGGGHLNAYDLSFSADH